MQSYLYWSGTQFSAFLGNGWPFATDNGSQLGNFESNAGYTLAVSPGQVGQLAPVPLPAAAWLMLIGVVGLGAMARRRRGAGRGTLQLARSDVSRGPLTQRPQRFQVRGPFT